MNALFVSTLLVCLVASVYSADLVKYNVTGGGKICGRMELKSTISVKDTILNKTVSFPLLPSYNYTGACAGQLASLVINMQSNGKLILNFHNYSEDNITCNMSHRFTPSQIFNSSDTIDRTTEGTYVMPPYGKAFLCKNTASYPFEGKRYETIMTNSDEHTQAFGLKDGEFGPDQECSSDNTTTTAKTTTTTAKTTTKTTAKTTTKTTTGTTTKPTTPAPDVTYKLMDSKNKTCVILTAALRFLVKYETIDNKTEPGHMNIPDVDKVEGTCPVNGSAEIKLVFGKSFVSFTLMDDSKTNMSTISTVSSELAITNNTFPNATTQTLNGTAEFKDSFSDDTFYVCNAGSTFTLSTTISVFSGQDFRIQAFNLQNETFSGNGDHCDADKSTTAAHTTVTTPATTTPVPNPTNNYTVSSNGTVCIFMKAALEFSITYENSSNENVTSMIYVPTSTKTSGDCHASGTTQSLTIMFDDITSCELDLVFERDSSASNDDDFKFSLANVSLSFSTSDLPNAKKNESVVIEAINVNQFQAESKGSYLCNSETDISLYSQTKNDTMYVNAVMKVTNLQYMAFNTDNSTAFPDSGVTECSADDSSNSIVPIAVGAALAGLVVIVIIAYLIGRKRSKRYGYESV